MLKTLASLLQTDDLVENAWRERKWPTFAITCLVTTIGIMILAFALVVVGGTVYIEASRLYWLIKQSFDPSAGTAFFASVWSQYISLFNFAVGFGAITGMFSVLSTVPAMLVKGVSGAPAAN